MGDKSHKPSAQLRQELTDRQREFIRREIYRRERDIIFNSLPNFYSANDFETILGVRFPKPVSELRTLDELLEKDKQREKDGFPRKIKFGKLSRPSKDGSKKVVIVPVVIEEKFYHDNKTTQESKEGGNTGGTGEEGEGEVIKEIPIDFEGDGKDNGAGEGDGGEHDIDSEAYEVGKVLTEKFELPNLRDKGKKRSFTKFKYDLTDKNRRTGQVLDKPATLKRIIETNLVLGRVSPEGAIDPTKLLIDPNDMIYRILSREKDYESEAVVFFLRDYSGSMYGKVTDTIVKQHLWIYCWLMYQYQNNVMSRFILHDTRAKEVPDFWTYYNSRIGGGTKISSSFNLVNRIVEEENLAQDYNIYVFYGSDGDDWEQDGREAVDEIKNVLKYSNRTGITVVKHNWGFMGEEGSRKTTMEQYMEKSGLLKSSPQLIRLDAMGEDEASEARVMEGIKRLISQKK